jgi:putative hemolysin
VLGELVPKSLALRATEQYALIIGRPLLGLAYLLQPAVRALTGTSNLVLGLFGDKTNFSETRHSPEEISQIVDEAAKSGAVDPKVGEIATRALEFGDLTAWDVMVPKGEVVAIAKSTSAEQLRDSMAKSRHTRIPVFDGDRDNIIGYISTKDILPALLDGGRCEIDKLLRRPFFVPETVPAVDLLQQLQRHRLHMAFVVDEHEAICGIVTFDDLVEELVGEFFGEHQRDAKPTFSSEVDGAVLAEGKTAIRDLNREFDWELPEDEDFSTLGGLVMSLADRIPEVGATFATDSGYTLEVVDGSARRVRTVRVRPPTKLEGDREITE